MMISDVAAYRLGRFTVMLQVWMDRTVFCEKTTVHFRFFLIDFTSFKMLKNDRLV